MWGFRKMNEFGVSWTPGILPLAIWESTWQQILMVVMFAVVMTILCAAAGSYMARRANQKFVQSLWWKARRERLAAEARANPVSSGSDTPNILPSREQCERDVAEAYGVDFARGESVGAQQVQPVKTVRKVPSGSSNIKIWFEDCVQVKQGVSTQGRPLYSHYCRWCEKQGVKQVGMRSWQNAMDTFDVQTTVEPGKPKIYHGIAIRTQLEVVSSR